MHSEATNLQKEYIVSHIQFRIQHLVVVLCLFFVATPVISVPIHAADQASQPDSEMAMAWFDLQLKLVQETPGFTPPVAARSFGYAGVALYETVVPGMEGYQSLVGQLNELTALPLPAPGADYHWPTAANSALATIIRRLFPTATEDNLAAIEALYTRYASQFEAEIESDLFNRSVLWGRVIAEAVYTWSVSDGGHEGYKRNFPTDYVSPVGAGLWIPTPRSAGDPQPALHPYWGNNRPFVLAAGDQCAPPAPVAYSESSDAAFYLEAQEVYQTVNQLDAEQIEIAQFWSDDPGATATPGGHSISILTQVLRQEHAGLALTAEAYARMGIALTDAFVGCWNIKYQYNLVRPVTYIQKLWDSEWMPILNTPPFPEYPSGHSVQSGAAAAVLTALFGDQYAFVDHTHQDRGFAPRSFNSFNEFAQEAAISRLYGGIHYRMAIEQGIEQGVCIGEQVNDLIFRTV
jgi:hypothetical protein